MNSGRALGPDNELCVPLFPPIHPPSQPGGNETSRPFHCEESRRPTRLSMDHVSRPVACCLPDPSFRIRLGRRLAAGADSGAPPPVRPTVITPPSSPPIRHLHS